MDEDDYTVNSETSTTSSSRYFPLQKIHIVTALSILTVTILLVYLGLRNSNDTRSNANDVTVLQGGGRYDGVRYVGSDLAYYRRDLPLIWIGGVPRSGTTLMRVMLDAHADIRCGEETRLIPNVLGTVSMHARTTQQLGQDRKQNLNQSEQNNNEEQQRQDVALGAFILSIIAKHGPPAPFLCNKDPFALRHMPRLLRIFPRSRFVLMLRDGRATVHSLRSRNITILGFDSTTFRSGLRSWNRIISKMYWECVRLAACLPVHYERLVLDPEREMRKILEFVEIRWDANVLHHEEAIGTDNGVSLSKVEPSTDQVDKAVNADALSKWVGHIHESGVRAHMDTIAPMLAVLGYDPMKNPPSYEELKYD